MGFSIGKFVGGAVSSLGRALTTPGSGVISTILGTGLQAAVGPQGFSGSVTPAVLAGARFPPPFRMPTVTGPAIGFAGGTVAELLRQSRETTGRPVSSRIIRESVRVCGIETTASAFGLSETDICRIAVSTGRRRARGISASDLRRTRSTIRKVSGIRKQLTALGAGKKVC